MCLEAIHKYCYKKKKQLILTFFFNQLAPFVRILLTIERNFLAEKFVSLYSLGVTSWSLREGRWVAF